MAWCLRVKNSSATTKLQQCQVEDYEILSVGNSTKPMQWDRTDLCRSWEPGNFYFEISIFESNDGTGVYGSDGTGTVTIQEREPERVSVVGVFIDFCCIS
jgi:hypothetical protein